MENITNLYDLSTLDISRIKLSDIPDYTSDMNIRRKELLEKMRNRKDSKEERIEYATLEFTRTADFFRDKVLADGVITPDEEKEVTIALQAMARVIKLRNGIDGY